MLKTRWTVRVLNIVVAQQNKIELLGDFWLKITNKHSSVNFGVTLYCWPTMVLITISGQINIEVIPGTYNVPDARLMN
jgi:hypothetical protein